MDYLSWIPERIAELRTQRNVSARDMSLSLGQSESYINKIENRRTLPSMAGFLYICEYLDVTPREFFDADVLSPRGARTAGPFASCAPGKICYNMIGGLYAAAARLLSLLMKGEPV